MRTLLLLMILGWCTFTRAQVVQLFGPNELGAGRTTLSFEGPTGYIPANTMYENIGVTLSRDDGFYVPLLQINRYGFQTTSGDNIIFSGFYPEVGPTNGGTTHIIIDFQRPVYEVGAFFGNDQYIPEFAFERLSVYGAGNEFLGSIDVSVNNNGHVDQFIGLRSDVPFHHARFENYDFLGRVATGYGAALDDVSFTTAVPEPSTYALIGLALVTACCMRRRRALR